MSIICIYLRCLQRIDFEDNLIFNGSMPALAAHFSKVLMEVGNGFNTLIVIS